eukprot:4691815-Pleurochrysis_carterae.AAC.2
MSHRHAGNGLYKLGSAFWQHAAMSEQSNRAFKTASDFCRRISISVVDLCSVLWRVGRSTTWRVLLSERIGTAPEPSSGCATSPRT